MNKNKIEKIVIRIRRVYIALAIFMFISTIIFAIVYQPNLKDLLERILVVLLYLSIYFGLRRRKVWVIPLVLIASALLSVTHIIGILYPPDIINIVVSRILDGLFLLFYSYQMFFFVRRDVGLFFGTKGRILL